MNLDEARAALQRHARVSARWGYPHDLSSVNTTGRIIGYSDKPQVLIETDGGEQLWWAIELTVLDQSDHNPPRTKTAKPAKTTQLAPCDVVAQAWDEGFDAGSARRPRVEVTRRNPYREEAR